MCQKCGKSEGIMGILQFNSVIHVSLFQASAIINNVKWKTGQPTLELWNVTKVASIASSLLHCQIHSHYFITALSSCQEEISERFPHPGGMS